MSRTPEEIFHRLMEAQMGGPEISVRDTSTPVIKVGGKTFAMLVKGRLVVKLRRERVEEILSSGNGESYPRGKPSKEWVSVDVSASRRWRSLIDEARDYVASGDR